MSKYKNGAGEPWWWKIHWFQKVKYELFTREKALAAIKNGLKHDRKPNTKAILKMVEAIDTETAFWPWCPSQVPVMFDPEGVRLNGLTRLYAIVNSKAGKATLPVIRGIPIEAYQYLDIESRSRNAKDALYNRMNVTRDTARVNWLHGLIAGNKFYSSSISTLRNKLEEQYRSAITWADKYLPGAGRTQRAPYAVALMYVYMCDKQFATEWAFRWKNGVSADGQGLPLQLARLRDQATYQDEHVSRKRTQKGGGRVYTHEDVTFKLLNILADIHANKPLPSKIMATSAGFKYWSQIRKDGAWKAYETQEGANKIQLDFDPPTSEDGVQASK